MSDLWMSDDQVAAMRDTVSHTLPGTCIIQATTQASDGAGGITETWAAVTGGTVACRLDKKSTQRNREIAGLAEANDYSYTLTLPYDAPISDGNRVVVDGTVYEVRDLWNAHHWRTAIKANVMRVK